MEIRAYSEDYLETAQRILGDMLDFAVNSCCLDPDVFYQAFLVSDSSIQFAQGNPSYVAGITGCELVRKVLAETCLRANVPPDVMYLEKSPEYWAGWALAYYQWHTAYPFSRIYGAASIEEICRLYPALHEADIGKFVEVMDSRMKEAYPETNLKRFRTIGGLSQRQLALLSGVPIRQIQLLEQRQRDINKARAITVFALAKALGCTMEALMER